MWKPRVWLDLSACPAAACLRTSSYRRTAPCSMSPICRPMASISSTARNCASSDSCRPARARTASTPAAIPRCCNVSNREEGSISVIDFTTRKVVYKWEIPHGTPDMGGVSADGKVLWLSGRYSKEVYAIDTGDGHLLARIRVGKGPHVLCVYPQPGRYSLGHTGVFR